MQNFWESTQKARKGHFCDYCFSSIEPGETYTRKVWVPQRGTFHVMKEHALPSKCPENEFGPQAHQEQALAVPIALALTTKQVVLVAQNGEPIIENRTVIEPVVVQAVPARSQEEDVSF